MTIKIGDLVQVVRGKPCCGHPVKYMDVFIVTGTSFWVPHPFDYCLYCGATPPAGLLAGGAYHEKDYGIFVSMLKKIDPTVDPESITEETEATKPA